MSNTPSTRKNALLDTLKSEYQLVNDAQVARFLDMQAPVISRMRAGAPVSDFIRVRVMRSTNWPITKLDELAPPLEK